MLETLNSDRVLNIDSRVIHNYKPFNRNKLIILHNGCIQNTAKMVKKITASVLAMHQVFQSSRQGPVCLAKPAVFPQIVLSGVGIAAAPGS